MPNNGGEVYSYKVSIAQSGSVWTVLCKFGLLGTQIAYLPQIRLKNMTKKTDLIRTVPLYGIYNNM